MRILCDQIIHSAVFPPRRRQTESVQVPLCNKDNNQKDVCKEQTETPQHPRINLFSFISLILFFHFSGESSLMQEIDEPFTSAIFMDRFNHRLYMNWHSYKISIIQK
jgi:hypothetical protein